MATAPTLAGPVSTAHSAEAGLLVIVGTMPSEALEAVLANIAEAFPAQSVLLATPDPPIAPTASTIRLTHYQAAAPAAPAWTLTAIDFLNTWKLMEEHRSAACLLLGPAAASLTPAALHALATSALSGAADLTSARYSLGPRDGLVNSAILYPTTRALFGIRTRFPLAIDLACSARMAERLAASAQKFTAANQSSALLWPVIEAAAAGLSLAEVPVGPRTLPPPDAADLNSLLTQVAGSLFADVEIKAGFWQRARLAYSPKAAVLHTEAATPLSAGEETASAPDVQPMLESFRIAYSNLHEVWSLVLPPNSLLGLKRLSQMSPTSFRMPDALWARIVFDFILAYRLRTINRGHLLGALTPLYLAWVASHLLLSSPTAGADFLSPEKHIEALAAAFEAEKPYLVSRWRWPDRFNP